MLSISFKNSRRSYNRCVNASTSRVITRSDNSY